MYNLSNNNNNNNNNNVESSINYNDNVDAAINKGEARMGFGPVLRNDMGRFVAARGMPWRGAFTPREAEVVAVREALSWIKELHYD